MSQHFYVAGHTHDHDHDHHTRSLDPRDTLADDDALGVGAGASTGTGTGTSLDAPNPYFLLSAQMASLLRADAFPRLRFVRDLSAASRALRGARPPPPRVRAFWRGVVARCAERGVWLEDCHGVNITQGALRRAELTAADADV